MAKKTEETAEESVKAAMEEIEAKKKSTTKKKPASKNTITSKGRRGTSPKRTPRKKV